MEEIRPGLRRWTAPHPEWRPPAERDSPADWDRDVGCALYDAPDAVCPESWGRVLARGLGRDELREALRPLLELPIERVLVSHGRPVLRRGRAALARALG